MSIRTNLLRRAIVATLLSSGISAQPPSPAPVFEVASIKPAIPMSQAMPLLLQGRLRAGISIDRARVDMEFVTLIDLIAAAYKLKPHQISGPDWLPKERFNIEARVPDGAAESDVPAMLQTLLAERFGMKAHNESRTVSAFALVAGKNGAKLEPSTLPPDPEPADGLETFTRSVGGAFNAKSGPAGPTQITMGTDGIRMILLRTTLPGLSDLLTSMVGRPVLDRTGIAGYYRIALDVTKEDVQNYARSLGIGAPAAPDTADPGGSSALQALEQLGLKLDSRKEQIETLVIDHIDKVPTAN